MAPRFLRAGALLLAGVWSVQAQEAGVSDGELSGALAEDDACAAGALADSCALSALQLRKAALGGAASVDGALSPLGAEGGKGGFRCVSDLDLGEVKSSTQKGICLDDTTFEHCAGEIPRFWPHTGDRVLSVRLFKPWGISPPTIFKGDRRKAWGHLKAFAHDNNATFLLGISVSCDPDADDREWKMAKEFMRELGPNRFMGLAIGNELELLWQKDTKYQNPRCLERLWSGNGYLDTFKSRVTELDEMPGFKDLPVTAVFGMYAAAGFPWVQNSNAGVNDFLHAVYKEYGNRFVFSLNLYPYFDASIPCDPVSIDIASTFNYISKVPTQVRGIRGRMRHMGAADAKLWVAETGWSTPRSDSVPRALKGCERFSSEGTFKNFYKNFLEWDLSGADHVFYFTIHDSSNFDAPEHFGLMEQCGSPKCKLQK